MFNASDCVLCKQRLKLLLDRADSLLDWRRLCRPEAGEVRRPGNLNYEVVMFAGVDHVVVLAMLLQRPAEKWVVVNHALNGALDPRGSCLSPPSDKCNGGHRRCNSVEPHVMRRYLELHLLLYLLRNHLLGQFSSAEPATGDRPPHHALKPRALAQIR